jgi:hypothetical protein
LRRQCRGVPGTYSRLRSSRSRLRSSRNRLRSSCSRLRSVCNRVPSVGGGSRRDRRRVRRKPLRNPRVFSLVHQHRGCTTRG